MSRNNLTIGLYLFLVFASGVAVGGFGYHLYSGTPVSAKVGGAPVKLSPEEWRKQYLSEMETRVHLTPTQVQQLNSILDETRTLFHQSREKHNRELQAVRDDQTNRIRAILTDEQRPEYEKVRTEREQRAKAANSKK